MDFRKNKILKDTCRPEIKYYKILGPGPVSLLYGRPKRTRELLALNGDFKGKIYIVCCYTIMCWMTNVTKAEEILYVEKR